MAKKQLIAVNGSGGAFVSVLASTFTNYVEIQEDGSATAQGLAVQYPSDNFTATYDYPVNAQPIKIGTPPNTGAPGVAPMAGKPVNARQVPTGAGSGYVAVSEPATTYCKVRSMTATATVIRVDERP